MTDLLTIAIPVFNRDAYFRQALESALNQTITTRVVVVDNASEMCDFSKILQAYARPNLTYQRNPTNLGMVGNWNQCIRSCATPYLLILHDDDVLELDYVSRFVQNYTPGKTLYWCPCRTIDQSGKVILPQAVPDLGSFSEPTAWCVANPSWIGTIFDRAKSVELGGFRPTLKFTPDWDLWVRLFLAGPSTRLPGLAGGYRQYTDTKRETTKLQQSARFWFYVNNQIKRNFSYLGQRATYLRYRQERRLPGGGARFVIDLSPKLTPRLLAYFIKTSTFSKPVTPGGYFARLVLKLGGLYGFYLLRWYTSLRLKPAGK